MLLCQTAGMAEHPADLPLDKARLAHEALIATLAQVGGQGRPDLLLIAVHRVPQLFQHRQPEGHRQRRAGAEKPALAFYNLLNIHDRVPPSAARS